MRFLPDDSQSLHPEGFLRRQNRLALLLLGVLAVALQVQVSLFAGSGSGYLGLRVNLADFLLPWAGVAVLASLLARRSFWPRWSLRWTWGWLVLLTLVVAGALAHSVFLYGDLSRWALLNKGVGWTILMAYMALGGWLATNAGSKGAAVFARVFVLFYLTVWALFTLVMLVQDFGVDRLYIRHHYPLFAYPMEGLMANRNAFAFLTCGALLLASFYHLAGKPLLPVLATHSLWALLPLSMVYNGSRAGWGMLAVMAVMVIATRPAKGLRLVLPGLGLALVLLFGLYQSDPDLVFREKQMQRMSQLYDLAQDAHAFSDKSLKYKGDTVRLTLSTDAVELWREHPVMGGGLGGLLRYQTQKHGEVIDILDCTSLWLLAETGLIGLLVFAGFYGAALFRLGVDGYRFNRDPDAFRYSVAMILICFAIMSLVHELLYTRHLWFLLGLALARPVDEAAKR